MPCPKCNNPAASGAFCTLCGTSLLAPPALAQTAYAPPPSYAPPPQNIPIPGAGPYGQPMGAQPPNPYGQPQPQNVALVPVAPMGIMPFRCGACGYTGQSMMIQRISTAGWITFGVLLVTCLPLFWIGLLIKETRCQCPNCRVVF
jgi:hypothetical protein|nr:hypothetical protein [Kofleriaceae bacterium]